MNLGIEKVLVSQQTLLSLIETMKKVLDRKKCRGAVLTYLSKIYV